MSVLKGDYIGFSFGKKADGTPMHSSDLGIVRTSNGSRFDENLLPTMQDKTVPVPGGDGTYYFGSYYTQRQFSVSFAFDSLTEEQVATLKSHFGDKKIQDLIFDERPYKIYRAKVAGSATLKYIPFSEGATNRLYKGEGTLQFTCYEPFARCEKKWLSDYSNWENVREWKDASGLKETQGVYDSIQQNNTIPLWNPGDIESNFQLRINFGEQYTEITFDENNTYTEGKYYIKKDDKYELSYDTYNESKSYFNRQILPIPAAKIFLSKDSNKKLAWEELVAQDADAYVKIDTKLNLIEGYNSNNKKTGNIYNEYITEGTFFKIPQGEETLVIDSDDTKLVSQNVLIEYNYYYF